MKKPVLVVLAAGMGSRYHGLKQIDPMGKYGEKILDYSVYDARRAGFETVVFVIKPEMEAAFEESVGGRLRDFMEVRTPSRRWSLCRRALRSRRGAPSPGALDTRCCAPQTASTRRLR